jgi:hypothetical protein
VTLTYTAPLARCHQRAVPVVDGVGRPIAQGARVRARRYPAEHRRQEEKFGEPLILEGTVIFLFEFGDYHPPEIEWRCEDPELELPILTSRSHLVGGCWKFETLRVVA